MNYIITLLAVVALIELYRVWVINVPVSQKRHFKAKLRGTTQARWDLTFKKYKTSEVREDIRKEYDYMQATISALEEMEKQEKDKEERDNQKDKITRGNNDLERLKTQLAQLDMEIHGAKPSNEVPNGYIGLQEQIEGYEELEGMLGDYIKTL